MEHPRDDLQSQDLVEPGAQDAACYLYFFSENPEDHRDFQGERCGEGSLPGHQTHELFEGGARAPAQAGSISPMGPRGSWSVMERLGIGAADRSLHKEDLRNTVGLKTRAGSS